MKRLIFFCAAILLAFPLGGCDSAQTSAEVYLDSGIADSGEGLTLYFEEEEAAAQALEEIYETVDVRGLAFANRDQLKNKFFINPDYLEEFHVKYASGRYGVADVFLLKPYPEYRADVRESLEQVKVSRVKEFENFDIYNSYRIAQDAVIFEQGEYVVMLMLDDTETARAVINRHLPQ